ncbi:MAG: ferritin [Ignavibacteriales bacterium CG07_land_8_20_14_0_80_59_12]|nr:MAG: ferritin [Ignavibacteriales bacterium CG07_land_8_20_14_0_80_59_12]
MISKSLQDAFNEQIGKEFYSSYLYLSMSAYCESVNLPGFAHWLKVQWKEEVSHAMKLIEYVVDRGGRVILGAIDSPPAEFKSPLEIFNEILEHEQMVTASINTLYTLAVEESDYASQVELQWFVKEQVEEEKTATEILEHLKLVGERSGALLFIDRHLRKRDTGK